MPYLILGASVLVALLIVRQALGRVTRDNGLELGIASAACNREVNADETGWSNNEDGLLAVLADGIGKETKGQTAAQAAVHTAIRMFDMAGAGENPDYFFYNAFHGANSSVLRYIPDGTAGASLLCAYITCGELYYALAGNIRISVFRNGELVRLSNGHTVDVLANNAFQRKRISRPEALEAVKSHRLYNFVGKYGFQDLELYDAPVVLKKGDIIALMTGGVFESYTERALEKALSSSRNCEKVAWDIINKLNASADPDQDNASIILIRVKEV